VTGKRPQRTAVNARLRSPVALAIVAVIGLISAACGSNAPSESGTASSSGSGTASKNTAREKAVKFSACMRDHGVSEFPDPDASGELTIDAVANGSSVDTDTAAFKAAISACRDLEPPGFTGHRRTAQQQSSALKFAQCMRDNGVPDFPDPTPDAPLIDTNRIPSAAGRGARDIPGLQAAVDTCREALTDALGRQR
jgi:hypothetical protein